MKPINMGGNISDMTLVIPYIRHMTLDYLIVDMENTELVTGDIAISYVRHATLVLPL